MVLIFLLHILLLFKVAAVQIWGCFSLLIVTIWVLSLSVQADVRYCTCLCMYKCAYVRIMYLWCRLKSPHYLL